MGDRPDRRPITDADRERVRELHGQGLSRNRIAREIGRSLSTVTKLARELGLSFDRGNDPNVQRAQEARKSDARSRRAALALALLEDAERMRQQLFAPCTVHNFGGKDNTFNQAMLDEPPARDKRDLMHAIGLALDRAVRLDAYDKVDDSASGVDAWLAAMTGTDP